MTENRVRHSLYHVSESSEIQYCGILKWPVCYIRLGILTIAKGCFFINVHGGNFLNDQMTNI